MECTEIHRHRTTGKVASVFYSTLPILPLHSNAQGFTLTSSAPQKEMSTWLSTLLREFLLPQVKTKNKTNKNRVTDTQRKKSC